MTVRSEIDEDVPEKDLPLREDIRYLGRILGDVVREQEGDAVFTIVERIRQNSVRFHRDQEEAARYALDTTLNGLSAVQTVKVIRAYSFFSHLANIAEDQHYIRRGRSYALAGAAPRDGSMASALQKARAAAIPRQRLQDYFESASVSPVLTAHPTEIRRRSILDRERDIAGLLDRRDRVAMTPPEAAANEEALRCAVLTLWQTSILRRNRLAVIDEVNNGLANYDYTFLHELPRFYMALEDELAADRIVMDKRFSTLVLADGQLDRR